MKKLLFILSILIICTSCDIQTIQKRDQLPISVVQKKQYHKYDTILTIRTYDETVFFDRKEKYIGTIENNHDYFGIGILTGLFICVCICALFAIFD